MESHLMGLTVDFGAGFVCFDAASKVSVALYRRHKCGGEPSGATSYTHQSQRRSLSSPFSLFRAAYLVCTVCIPVLHLS